MISSFTTYTCIYGDGFTSKVQRFTTTGNTTHSQHTVTTYATTTDKSRNYQVLTIFEQQFPCTYATASPAPSDFQPCQRQGREQGQGVFQHGQQRHQQGKGRPQVGFTWQIMRKRTKSWLPRKMNRMWHYWCSCPQG